MEAPQGGFFLAIEKKPFAKPALTFEQQIELLEKRGMLIPDKSAARHYLKFIGYYRLSGYFRYFADPADPAREKLRGGTTFVTVLNLYIFDRKLRTLLMDAFERIEIALKASLSHQGAVAKGAFWMCNPNNFDHGTHSSVLKDIDDAIGNNDDKAQHLFIAHFYNKYSDERPPSWMIVETMSFGAISRTFKRSKGDIQNTVAVEFGLHRTILESWMHALAFGRNVCAHNCRLWNRTFTIKPKIPKKYVDDLPDDSHDRLYVLCFIIHHMMKVIADGSGWHDRLRALVNERGDLPLKSLGFPDDWEGAAHWGFNPKLKSQPALPGSSSGVP